MKICKIQGTKIYQFHTIIRRLKEQKYDFFQTLSKVLHQLLYLAHSKQLKSLTNGWKCVHRVFAHYGDLYVDVTMTIFHVFSRYKKIIIIIIEIIEKKIHLSKTIIIHLSIMKK
jgi:hypothetical protein